MIFIFTYIYIYIYIYTSKSDISFFLLLQKKGYRVDIEFEDIEFEKYRSLASSNENNISTKTSI